MLIVSKPPGSPPKLISKMVVLKSTDAAVVVPKSTVAPIPIPKSNPAPAEELYWVVIVVIIVLFVILCYH